jgi:hypothetical protein
MLADSIEPEAETEVRLIPALAAIAFALSLQPAMANDGPDWLDDPNKLEKGVTTNDNVLIQKDSSAVQLLMLADRALKSDKVDRAIDLIKRSLDLNMDDLDAHMSYAMALERKLQMQKVEDPAVFNLCVKEWLAVLRNKYGEEKAETIDGIGIPGINGRFFADDERHTPARNHLVKLTGTAPKPWETDKKFLAKVCRHGETSVSAKVVQDPYAKAKAPATSKADDDAPKKAKTKIGADPFPDEKTPL